MIIVVLTVLTAADMSNVAEEPMESPAVSEEEVDDPSQDDQMSVNTGSSKAPGNRCRWL